MQSQRYKILGCPCAGIMEDEATEQIISLIREKKAGYMVAINAEKIWRYKSDKNLQSVIDKSIFPYPDGAGAVLGLRWLFGIKSEKVNMPIKALEAADRYRLRTFILGANETNHELAVANIMRVYPKISLVGHLHGYHEKEFIFSKIIACEPQLVLIAMGSPVQEIWADELISKTQAGIMVGCGGALDILSGTVARAPMFMIKNNLEWFYRLCVQPWRFWRQLFLPCFFLQLTSAVIAKKFISSSSKS